MTDADAPGVTQRLVESTNVLNTIKSINQEFDPDGTVNFFKSMLRMRHVTPCNQVLQVSFLLVACHRLGFVVPSFLSWR